MKNIKYFSAQRVEATSFHPTRLRIARVDVSTKAEQNAVNHVWRKDVADNAKMQVLPHCNSPILKFEALFTDLHGVFYFRTFEE